MRSTVGQPKSPLGYVGYRANCRSTDVRRERYPQRGFAKPGVASQLHTPPQSLPSNRDSPRRASRAHGGGAGVKSRRACVCVRQGVIAEQAVMRRQRRASRIVRVRKSQERLLPNRWPAGFCIKQHVSTEGRSCVIERSGRAHPRQYGSCAAACLRISGFRKVRGAYGSGAGCAWHPEGGSPWRAHAD
jgi:hypothetical protein